VLSHGPAVNAVDPQNVVLIRDPVIRRNHFLGYVIDECDFRLLDLNSSLRQFQPGCQVCFSKSCDAQISSILAKNAFLSR
jgi:hypothetical protein